MNESELDAQLRRLHGSAALRADPSSPAADALLSIVLADVSPVVPSSSSVQAVELLDFAPESTPRRSGVLVAACVAVLALAGAVLWYANLNQEPDELVLEVSNGDTVEPTPDSVSDMTLIVGAREPVVIAYPSELVDARIEILQCVRQGQAEGNAGVSPFFEAAYMEAQGGSRSRVFLDAVDSRSSCSNGSSTGFSFGSLARSPNAANPVIIDSYSSDEPRSEIRRVLTGRLTEDVADIRVVSPEADDQLFRRSGDRFALEVVSDRADLLGFEEGVDEVQIQVELADGSNFTGSISDADLHGDPAAANCPQNRTCVDEALADFRQEAETLGAGFQATALTDLLLTQDEFDTSVEEFRSCLATAGLVSELSSTQTILPSTAEEIALARECYGQTMRFSNQARAIQNAHVRFLEGDFDSEVSIEEVDDAPSPTTTLVRKDLIPPGELRMEPAGPYVEGQIVTLIATDPPFIDLFNSSPRLCASIDGAYEVCSADWLRPDPVSNPAPGTQAVSVALPRVHFGPDGATDCNELNVTCRILWRDEAGDILHGPPLGFSGASMEMPVTEPAEILGPNLLAIYTAGLAFDTDVANLSDRQLDYIRDSVLTKPFDISRLTIQWDTVAICGFGEGGPPIGSSAITDQPSWWNYGRQNLPPDLHFFGPVCDSLPMAAGSPSVGEPDQIRLAAMRNIYGYGGWIDCAVSDCYVVLGSSWRYPETGGGIIGGELDQIRVDVDIPSSWPDTRPSISIVEPGPYRDGQTVTVEIRDFNASNESFPIGFCPGGEGFCSWNSATEVDGVLTAQWTIRANVEECSANRCYFAVGSGDGGLPPPAVVVVPMVE